MPPAGSGWKHGTSRAGWEVSRRGHGRPPRTQGSAGEGQPVGIMPACPFLARVRAALPRGRRPDFRRCSNGGHRSGTVPESHRLRDHAAGGDVRRLSHAGCPGSLSRAGRQRASRGDQAACMARRPTAFTRLTPPAASLPPALRFFRQPAMSRRGNLGLPDRRTSRRRPDGGRARGAARPGCRTSHAGYGPREWWDRAQQRRAIPRGRGRRGGPGSQPGRGLRARRRAVARDDPDRATGLRVRGDGSPGYRDDAAPGRPRPARAGQSGSASATGVVKIEICASSRSIGPRIFWSVS